MDKTVSHSRYSMFRCMLAIAHADGILNDAEIGYFEGFMNRVPFSEGQKEQLEDDIRNAKDVFDIFREINDPEYRSQVLFFCRIMAYKDGVLHPKEEDILKKLHFQTTDGLDMEQIKEQAQDAINKEMLLKDVELSKDRQALYKSHFIPWFWVVDKALLTVGIDLLDN